MKIACYTGTRNLYKDMVPAVKSLLHNSDVDKVYLLIEDDEFPEWLPPQVETINMSGQTFFPADGPNMKNQFTYMALIRSCFTKIFPDADKILQLDVDTVVVNDISGLWDMVPDDKWFGAVIEHNGFYHPWGDRYYNIGVAVINLARVRADKADDMMINYLRNVASTYIDQDAWNKFGIWKDVELPVRYNESDATGYTDDPAIIHFCRFRDLDKNIRAPRKEYLKKYREMSWEEALNGREGVPSSLPKDDIKGEK